MLYAIIFTLSWVDYGLGLKVSSRKGGGGQNGTSVGDSGSGGEEEMEEETGKQVVRALYAFSGTNEDEVGGRIEYLCTIVSFQYPIPSFSMLHAKSEEGWR